MRPKRVTIFILTIISSFFFLTKCIEKNNDNAKKIISKNVSFQEFAGSVKCINCHRDIYKSHINTGHFLTSRPATEKSISGSFETGKNKYFYNSNLFVAMEKRDSGLYQVAYYKGIEKKARKFDITVGSGKRGQSYIYWQDNRLFQLPITYYTFAKQWSNSPGYPSKVQFDRPITPRCLECHSTFADMVSSPGNSYDEFEHTHLIYGVDCEKCHGPAARHVEFQTQNPVEKKARYIINPANFSRQQKLDLCALCHGGKMNQTQPSFTFAPGDTLAQYFITDTLSAAAINFDNVDVHGNQYELLKASKCFRMSKNMTCNSCHNTHENERGKLTLFSERCIACHNNVHENFTTVSNIHVSSLKQNCVDCHMPSKPSKNIVIFFPGEDVPTAALFRSHFISIYKNETKNVVRLKKKLH